MKSRIIPLAVTAVSLFISLIPAPADSACTSGIGTDSGLESMYGLFRWPTTTTPSDCNEMQPLYPPLTQQGSVFKASSALYGPRDAPAVPVAALAVTYEGDLAVSESQTLTNKVGTAQAALTGIAGSDAGDTMVKNGALQVTTAAAVNVSGVSLEIVDTGDARRQAIATAGGVVGGTGSDSITVTGDVTVLADAAVKDTGFNLSLIGGSSDKDAGSLARSQAVGVDGGGGNDLITMNGITRVTAQSTLESNQVGVSVLHAEKLRASLESDAAATGVSGGSGDDTIRTSGELHVVADAKASALDVRVSAAELASGETKTGTLAHAIGIESGTGTDQVVNSAVMNVKAKATTSTTGVNVSLVDLSLIPALLDPNTSGDGSITARADATGISGGNGTKNILNQGGMEVTATAGTTTFDFSWSAYSLPNPADVKQYIDFFKNTPVIDASTTAEATAVGIGSGTGNDVITNNAVLTARATATVSAGTVSVDFPVPDIIPISIPGLDTTEVATSATAKATGIGGGEGDNTVVNSGALTAEATALATSWSVGVSLQPSLGGGDEPSGGAAEWFPSLNGSLVDIGAKAEAGATGIETGAGSDHIRNSGGVAAKATAAATATDVAVTLAQSEDKLAASLSLANASTAATAAATGIASGAGNDEIVTTGEVRAETVAGTTSTTVAVDVNIIKDTKVTLGALITSANTDSVAGSTGISSGAGDDTIKLLRSGSVEGGGVPDAGSVVSHAGADATAVGVIVGVAAGQGKDFSLVGEGAWAKADTRAVAAADGVNGGEGADKVFSEGTIESDARADAHSVGVAVSGAGTKKGVSAGVALVQARSEAETAARGVSGEGGNDEIVTAGMVKSHAQSDVEAESISVALSLTDKGVALTGTAADGSTRGSATASGITGDDGVDSIRNDGAVDVTSLVNATSVSVSVAAQGASKGVALGVALSRATSEAVTVSSGIDGGNGADTIVSTGLVTSGATSNLIAGSGALAAGGTGKGVTAEGAAADGSATGTATASGLSGGAGNDLVQNSGTVDVSATVDATTVSAAVSANGSGTGLTLGVGLARATSEGTAFGSGISGGDGDDTLSNSLLVKSRATATVVAGSGALAAGGTGKGVTLEGAAADGSSTGIASVVGLSGDRGSDVIQNTGSVDVLSLADTTSVSVAASANGTGTGVALGVALSRAVTTAEANGTAISGGADNDVIRNSGALISSATANVAAVSVGASLGGTGTGVALQGAAADASTVGTARAVGISGGQGVDYILNEGSVDTISAADSSSTSVSVSASGTGTGVGLGAALTRAGTTATATSTGISLGTSGDSTPLAGIAGLLIDYAENRGHITTGATATADSASIGVQLGITGTGLQAGAALADASTTASADAYGISGGGRDDAIVNKAAIDATSYAQSDSTSVSVSFNVSLEGATLGAAITDATTAANAVSTGISDNSGNNWIDNQAAITATATSTASGVGVSVSAGLSFLPLNAAIADMATVARSTAAGIATGAGHDVITSTGPVLATAGSTATGTTVSVAPFGASLGSADVSSFATAVGIDGGTGDNSVVSGGTVTATATSRSTGTVVNATLVGATGNLLDSVNTLAEAVATGISVGDGRSRITSNGALAATADAGINSTAVNVGLTGAAIGAMNSTARATAIGIQGGTGDELITNLGTITNLALAKLDPTSVGVVLTGASLGDNTTNAEATSRGISGGAGNDGIENGAAISVTSTATTTARGVTVALLGDAEGDADVTATGSAIGISGDDGGDRIWNHGKITASATAGASVVGDAWSVAGNSAGSSILKPEARAYGIDGGRGSDIIDNDADIELTAVTSTQSTARSVTILAGASGGDAGVLALSGAIGLFGNDGNDRIDNQGRISGSSTATVTASSLTYTTAGASLGNSAQTTGDAFITGIAGGTGNDIIRNAGAIDITTTATTNSTSTSISIFGTSAAGDGLSARALATGIDGGAGDDLVENLVSVAVVSHASVTMAGSSFSFGGSGASGGTMAATSSAFGMNGGEGRDTLLNSGALEVTATSNLATSGGSTAVFGTSSVGGTSGAFTQAAGIEGGGDDDYLENKASVDVTAHSTVALDASSFTLGGTGSAGGTLAAVTGATALSGGSGADTILNRGDLTVTATSLLSSLGESNTVFGTSAGTTTSGATTEATGINGGDGNDSVENSSGHTIDVHATTTVTSTKSSYTFGGTATAEAVLKGAAIASGISGGSGSNLLSNLGDVTATAVSTVSASGGTKTTFGGTTGSGAAAAETTSTGIGAGESADSLFNAGRITVVADSNTAATNSSDAGWLVGDGDTVSTTRTTAAGTGMSAGDGSNTVTNDGEVIVTARGTGYAFAYASGAHLSWDGDGESRADSVASSRAIGVMAGNGSNQIVNNNTIHVTAAATTVKDLTTTINVCSQSLVTRQVCHDEPDPNDSTKTIRVCVDVQETVTTCTPVPVVLASLPTYAGANGNGVTGTGRATALGTVTAEAYGIKVGDGNNLIINNQDITVSATPEARVTVFADGDAFGDAIGTATATATAKAYGMWAGDGANTVSNNGILTVLASPRAQARTEVSGGDICIWYLFGTWCGGGGDGIGSASTIFDLLATGIQVGNGDNQITNNGVMTVTARPEASDFTAAVVSANSATVLTSVSAKAVGIQTGNGNNRVTNTVNGVIDVRASDLPVAYGCTNGTCVSSFEAVGIQTGSGNDLVINNGRIMTSVPTGSGVGIRTGGGSDTVMLGNGSSVIGSIDLGDGDDILHLVGTPEVIGAINPGTGTNSLVFEGAGSFAPVLSGFTNAAKTGNGTYTVPALSSMQRLDLQSGVLRVTSGYQFAGSGLLLAHLNGNGSYGQLSLAGTGFLGGSLAVVKGPGRYLNGAYFDIVQSDTTLEGGFGTITLPDPSVLLSFRLNQLADTVRIEAVAKSFTTVAANRTQMLVAGQLDRIMPSATGQLAVVLGEMQGLPASGFSRTLTSLSPDSYAGVSVVSLGTTAQYLRMVDLRMQGIRSYGMASGSTIRSDIPLDKGLLLAYSGSDASIAGLIGGEKRRQPAPRFGVWIDGFGKKGSQTGGDGSAGFGYQVAGGAMGLDFLVGDKAVIGVSGGQSSTNIDLDESRGTGHISSTFASLYGSYFTDTYFLDASCAYSHQNFSNNRSVSIGLQNFTARSEHAGHVYAASLGGGYTVDLGAVLLQPVAGLRYINLSEERFNEKGAGSVNLIVGERVTESLTSEVGLRVAKVFQTGWGGLVPDVRVAWKYDFAIDDRLVSAAYEGAPDSTFAVPGQDSDRHGATVGAGMTLLLPKGFSTNLKYDGEFRSSYRSHGLFGELRYAF